MEKGLRKGQGYRLGDGLIALEAAVIGMAEVSNLASVLLGHPFSDCVVIIPMLTVALLIGVAGHIIVKKYAPADRGGPSLSGETGRAKWVFCGIALALLAGQLFAVLTGDGVYRQGDMTVETVKSFLETDAVYSVNPLTGQEYVQGLPSRIKILCLPTLYGSICLFTGLSPQFVVWKLIPALTLISSYFAFWLLGKSLFSGDGKKRALFLACYALLLQAGTYRYGMDGFGAFFCGFRGVTIRNVVLLPWLFSLLLRKKWALAALCIVAEGCIVWTFYGLGVCAAATAGMAAAELAVRLFSAGKEAG